MQVSGSRVLVTGASRGIGLHLAEAFASAGADVAVVARSKPALDDLAARIGGRAYCADLTDRHDVAGLVDRMEADGGAIDVLVNNAGVDEAGSFLDATPEQLERAYRLNLLTPAELCRQVLPGMVGRGRGHIVNIGSLAGVGPFPGLAAYSSTKAGLAQLTAGLRADLRGLPVGTTLVELGPVMTDMLVDAEGYRPTHLSFQRARRLQLLPDTAAEDAAGAVVDAVTHGRRHVRLPRRAAILAMTAELPRRFTEFLLTGVPHRA
jgi:short-subunit dehydrogenase